MMTRRHKQGVDRRAAGSLPACLEDCMEPENPVRAVDAYVDALDVVALGVARTEPNPTAAGRPSFPPSALLKLCLYGYLNRVRSSRRLERGCARNAEALRRVHARACRPVPGVAASGRAAREGESAVTSVKVV
jgi:transposase